MSTYHVVYTTWIPNKRKVIHTLASLGEALTFAREYGRKTNTATFVRPLSRPADPAAIADIEVTPRVRG